MLTQTQGPLQADTWNGPTPQGDLAGGEIGVEDEAQASSRQAPPAASLADADVTIEEINEQIRAANDAIGRAADFVSQANEAIAEANTLIESWTDGHPDSWPIDPIDEVDEPCEIEELDEVEVD